MSDSDFPRFHLDRWVTGEPRVLSLADFLLARIAEDEEVARTAAAGDADPASRAPIWTSLGSGRPGVCDHGPRGSVEMQPARVLAECEAKGRIVKAFEEERVRRDIYNRDYDSGEYDFNDNDLRARLASNARCRGLEKAMLALATVYAGHPDYREWQATNVVDDIGEQP